MEILLAKTRGFCGGVSRAIDIVEKALSNFGTPIYVLHEIVHNKRVLSDLSKQGVVFVASLDQVPANSVLVFSAHGVSKSVAEYAAKNKLRVIDATCPLVTKVHVKAQKYESEGRQVIIIGKKDHVEVVGTSGQLKQKPIIILSKEEAESIAVDDPNKLAAVTQTTLNSDDTFEIIAALKKRFPNIAGVDSGDICNATKIRQDAVKELVKNGIDALIVIGSKNSSNSNKLRDIGAASGIPAYLIDGTQDINLDWFKNVKRLGITAGASAPECSLNEVIDFLTVSKNAVVASN